MDKYYFLDDDGTFTIDNPENYNYLYFPIAGEDGIKSSLTPTLGGDSKLDQNTFILEPVSAENLHNNKSTRNFWCNVKGKGIYSCTGVSALQMSKRFTDRQEKSKITAGFMWQKVERESGDFGIHTEITSFVPVHDNLEIMLAKITNISKETINVIPTAAIPIYGRSATNIRDHRHVTSLLHRIKTTDAGVLVTPTLSFDERGHQINDITYYVCGYTGDGQNPKDFYPIVEDFIGEGGNFERPLAVVNDATGMKANQSFEGLEAIGGLHFGEKSLGVGETATYIILIGATNKENDISKTSQKYSNLKSVENSLDFVKDYWKEKVNVTYHTGNKDFDALMKWVSFQPILRRIYGCSFLPHHDYGKGGRGWRDLWQDCLALLIMNPNGVRKMLLSNFAGVRIDGTNATIIGSRQGEFIADRNNITRVWMDHGVWPCITTKLYIDQTGDIDILEENVPYFKDKQIARGTKTDLLWNETDGSNQMDENEKVYQGTVLEHLLLQNLSSFYEVGNHNEIKLRGADWNDALDMADKNGESVAFTNAIAGNLKDLADLLISYRKLTGKKEVLIAQEVLLLLQGNEQDFESVNAKNKILQNYMNKCLHTVSGNRVKFSVEELIHNLSKNADFIFNHIRKTEWVTDKEGNGWFNGYYDNHGRQVEGESESGVRMMLTSQVFSVMNGTATDEQVKSICKSSDKYLYNREIGGYRLNTNFYEVKTDLGRMFGFSYGDKENGAVFCHMAVMYANALYKRGFVKEGYKVLNSLSDQSLNFKVSKIYPGIPEYFNGRGRGMYHYLTGAASWYMLTVITEMFGVKGRLGNLVISPKLLSEQFDKNGEANLKLTFANKQWNITYNNQKNKNFGEYIISSVHLNNVEIPIKEGSTDWVLSLEQIELLDNNKVQNVIVILK